MPCKKIIWIIRLTILFIFFQIYSSSAQEIQINIPQQYENSLNGKDLSIKEVFYPYPFISENVNLIDFKKKQPDLELPNFIKIKLPNLEGISDTTLLLGCIKENTNDPGLFILLVTGNYNTYEVTFFVDTNMDQNYLNDGTPIIVQAGAAPTYIQLHPTGKKSRDLGLSVPEKLDEINLNLQQLKRKFKARIINKLSVGILAGAGTGKLTYQYDNVDLGFPTWYSVSLSEKDLGLSLSYNFPIFRIGLSATYNHIYYYTSYLNVRYNNPMGIRNGVLTERNIDQHAQSRLQLGLSAAYRIPLGHFAEIQPVITYGKNIYLSKEYFSDTRPNKEIAYGLSPNSFLEMGGQVEFTTGFQKVIFLNILRNQLWWKPNNFLETINYNNLQTKHLTWKITMGYRIAL